MPDESARLPSEFLTTTHFPPAESVTETYWLIDPAPETMPSPESTIVSPSSEPEKPPMSSTISGLNAFLFAAVLTVVVPATMSSGAERFVASETRQVSLPFSVKLPETPLTPSGSTVPASSAAKVCVPAAEAEEAAAAPRTSSAPEATKSDPPTEAPPESVSCAPFSAT